MIVDYDSKPANSIFYTAALLYKHILSFGFDVEKTFDYFCRNINQNTLLYYYSLDWLFLAGKIDLKNGELFLCD